MTVEVSGSPQPWSALIEAKNTHIRTCRPLTLGLPGRLPIGRRTARILPTDDDTGLA